MKLRPRVPRRLLFSNETDERELDPAEVTSACRATLRFAIRYAADREKQPLLAIDDADQLDGTSLLALGALLRDPPSAELRVIMTSSQAPDESLSDVVRARWITGLSAADAEGLLGCDPCHEDVEPLFVQLLKKWSEPAAIAAALPTLADLSEACVRALTPGQRRTLQALAVLGEIGSARLASVVGSEEVTGAALPPLQHSGFVRNSQGRESIRHAIHARVTLAMTPAGALETLHEKAAHLLPESHRTLELRVFHLLRAQPEFDTFLLAEEVARLRSRRGDLEGVVSAFSAAASAARQQAERGAPEVASAQLVFAYKLGGALLAVGHVNEALSVLLGGTALPGPRAGGHALVLEQLAHALSICGHTLEAERRRGEALAIAQQMGDPYADRTPARAEATDERADGQPDPISRLAMSPR